jgi:Second Messenger Oligonucleotide or Dinucleotide Synthetase domain
MGKLQKRLTTFVQWIATEASREDEIREQARYIRDRISAKARGDDLTVRSTPNSGSFANRTGLRRHLLGASVVEGQDVDLPFVVAPHGDNELDELLDRFSRYVKACYPETELKRTRSSIKLLFTNTKLSYDIVPMLATKRDDRQIILQASGERRETSVQEHTAFVRERTRKSQEQPGRVQFNECIRLLKWWREFKQDQNPILPEVPSSLAIFD